MSLLWWGGVERSTRGHWAWFKQSEKHQWVISFIVAYIVFFSHFFLTPRKHPQILFSGGFLLLHHQWSKLSSTIAYFWKIRLRFGWDWLMTLVLAFDHASSLLVLLILLRAVHKTLLCVSISIFFVNCECSICFLAWFVYFPLLHLNPWAELSLAMANNVD